MDFAICTFQDYVAAMVGTTFSEAIEGDLFVTRVKYPNGLQMEYHHNHVGGGVFQAYKLCKPYLPESVVPPTVKAARGSQYLCGNLTIKQLLKTGNDVIPPVRRHVGRMGFNDWMRSLPKNEEVCVTVSSAERGEVKMIAEFFGFSTLRIEPGNDRHDQILVRPVHDAENEAFGVLRRLLVCFEGQNTLYQNMRFGDFNTRIRRAHDVEVDPLATKIGLFFLIDMLEEQKEGIEMIGLNAAREHEAFFSFIKDVRGKLAYGPTLKHVVLAAIAKRKLDGWIFGQTRET